MKRFAAVVSVMCLILALLAGCGTSNLGDLQADLDMYNSTLNSFGLGNTLNTLLDRNANLLAGRWTEDSDEFTVIEDELTDTVKDAVDVIKDMPVKSAEGKTLKAAYLSLFQTENDLLAQNIKWVKNGNASAKQEAMEMSQGVAAAQKAHSDALASLQNAITEAKATK